MSKIAEGKILLLTLLDMLAIAHSPSKTLSIYPSADHISD
jgi:hypothetical protein